jgi:uncharacterized protein (DUF1684 family)
MLVIFLKRTIPAIKLVIKLVATLSAMFIATQAVAVDIAQEQHDVEQWRAARVGRLTGPTGWLTLVGLYWFNEGGNTFGRSEKNTLVLDHKAMPDTLGTFTLAKGKVVFSATPGSVVTAAGKPIKSIAMAPDTSDEPTVLDAGSIQFHVIERAGKIGLRVRDTEHPARKNFRGIDYFPISAAWAVDAKFVPYSPVRYIEIINILGMTEKMESPGAVVFNRGGKEYRLDVILEAPEDNELFIMFADSTSARETYGAGRFIYIPLPSKGRAIVDFNKAYNPPCAFNDFATCPLPPPQNRLQLRVDAGEKKYVADRH